MSQAKGMSELDLKIAAIEFALRSFAREANEETRRNNLKENFHGNPYLETYFTYSAERLQITLDKLLQLQIENAKQPSSTQGNLNYFHANIYILRLQYSFYIVEVLLIESHHFILHTVVSIN